MTYKKSYKKSYPGIQMAYLDGAATSKKYGPIMATIVDDSLAIWRRPDWRELIYWQTIMTVLPGLFDPIYDLLKG